MKRVLVAATFCFLTVILCTPSGAVIGIPDQVTAATVIVPFIDVGVDSVANPNDTHAVLFNWRFYPVIVHYEVWSMNGQNASIWGNFTINSGQSVPISLRGLINSASSASRDILRVNTIWGQFYWGFMTFDVVTASTSMMPIDASYPFSSDNALEGYIYYNRLTAGSANGIPMVHIEATSVSDYRLHGFYQYSDNREEIDADARYSAENMTRGGGPATNPGNSIYRTHMRIFASAAASGLTKLIIFTFPEEGHCLGDTSCGPGSVTVHRICEDGSDTSFALPLNSVVNVFKQDNTCNGMFSLWDIPSGWEVYAFSINSANPPGDPYLTWDAIFPAAIIPY